MQGQAILQVGVEEFEIGLCEYCNIMPSENHSLMNIGNDECVLVKVQMGSYLGKDGIVLIKDVIGRS